MNGRVCLVSLRFAVVISLLISSLSLCVFPRVLAADYEYSYWVLDHPDGSDRFELNVSVSSSLYEYYVGKDHTLRSRLDLGKFVTPYALEPIADSLSTLYEDDEDFANGVLMIVHQIPYEASAPQKYPVETIAANEGDCDLFSFIAASVMVAGGLDVVLLFYDSEDHMNIGVNLSHAPEDARTAVSYFTYDGKRYYMAETTGGAWETGWRVGECPESFEGVSAQILTLEDAEQVSPGQVSASFGSLTGSSSVTLSVSSSFLIEGSSVVLSGIVAPASVDGIVTIYTRSEDSTWVILEAMACGLNGRYSHEWKPDSAKVYYVRASWSGDSTHAGADSNVSSVRVVSSSLVMLAVMFIVLAAVAVVVYAVSRRVGKVNEYSVAQ
jgi:hypothetical protein